MGVKWVKDLLTGGRREEGGGEEGGGRGNEVFPPFVRRAPYTD